MSRNRSLVMALTLGRSSIRLELRSRWHLSHSAFLNGAGFACTSLWVLTSAAVLCSKSPNRMVHGGRPRRNPSRDVLSILMRPIRIDRFTPPTDTGEVWIHQEYEGFARRGLTPPYLVDARAKTSTKTAQMPVLADFQPQGLDLLHPPLALASRLPPANHFDLEDTMGRLKKRRPGTTRAGSTPSNILIQAFTLESSTERRSLGTLPPSTTS